MNKPIAFIFYVNLIISVIALNSLGSGFLAPPGAFDIFDLFISLDAEPETSVSIKQFKLKYMMVILNAYDLADKFSVSTVQKIWTDEYYETLTGTESYELLKEAISGGLIGIIPGGEGFYRYFYVTEKGKQVALGHSIKPLDVEIAGLVSDEVLRDYLHNVIQPGMVVADMGAARGKRAIVSARLGATVDAIEIHKDTLKEALKRFDAQPASISNRIRPILSDLFENPVISGKKYDRIVFSPPKCNEKIPSKRDDFLRIIEDPEFKLLRRFLSTAGEHLKPDGKLILAYGDEDDVDEKDGHVYTGGMQTLVRLAGDAWSVKRTLLDTDGMFGIYELTHKKAVSDRPESYPKPSQKITIGVNGTHETDTSI